MDSDSSSLSRREALRLFSGATLALLGGRLASAETPPPANMSVAPSSAPLTPELTEGPYYIDLERIRRDITEGKPGVPLHMTFRVVNVKTGASVPDAAVDLWHCDASGVYSGFSSHPPAPGGGGHPGGPPPGMDMDDDFFPPGGGPDGAHKAENKLTFLRGVQITGSNGVTQIETIYPGWYMGRTTHIHVRVHLGGTTTDRRYQGGHISHTGQIFLPESISDQVYQLPAYARKEQGRMLLQDDGIYRQGGSLSMTKLVALDARRPGAGYHAETLLVIDPTATPQRA